MGIIDTRIANSVDSAAPSVAEERPSARYPRVVSRLKVIEPLVRGKDVLDIGCVDARPGGVRKYESTGLHKFVGLHARSLLGVDIDADGVEEMRAKGHNIVCANAENMRLEQQFDCIVAGELLEHLNNAGNFLATMAEHLKDDGVLVLTTPNAFGISNIFRIFRSNRIKVHPDHTCWYDPQTLIQLVNRYPLKVENIYFANKDKWYRPRYFYKIFRYQLPKLITWIWPYYSGTIIAVIKKKK